MGVSTDAQICYGVSFDEGDEMPWEGYDDIDEWWDDHLKSTSKPEGLPLPFLLVNSCSEGSPQYILAVPGTFINAKRGYPEEFEPISLIAPQNRLVVFLEFLEEFDLPNDCGWWLSSFWSE